jgi:4-carboxymuconolactone decarboxylase
MTEPFDLAAGEARLAQLQDDETTAAWRSTVDAAAPGFDRWIVGAVFGGTYEREGLSLRDRQLLTIGALTALGGVDPQLRGHLTTARRVGMTAQEVAEALVHLVPYVGLPRVIAALRLLPPTTGPSPDDKSPSDAVLDVHHDQRLSGESDESGGTDETVDTNRTSETNPAGTPR